MYDFYNRICIRNKIEIDNVNKIGFIDKMKRKIKILFSY